MGIPAECVNGNGDTLVTSRCWIMAMGKMNVNSQKLCDDDLLNLMRAVGGMAFLHKHFHNW
jgi:hypothetical protein